MMPLWNNAETKSFKSRLESKMCFAKETPEPYFDLADCNLSNIPSGVFSMCRVFLKQSLFLQNNRLTSLKNGGSLKDLSGLLVLHLQNNRLSSLPDDIHHLTSLQELNLENNLLKKLPASFSKLEKLNHLNLKANRLVNFPEPVCSLLSLETLIICDNPKVQRLPRYLSKLVNLKCLEIDAQSMIHPSSDVCLAGTEQIMKFLSLESEQNCSPSKSPEIDLEPDEDFTDSKSASNASADLSTPFEQYHKTKLERRQTLLLMEEALKQNASVQANSVMASDLKRHELLQYIIQDQARMESELQFLHNQKAKEKQQILEMLHKVEKHSAKMVDHLLALHDSAKEMNKTRIVAENDRILSEELLVNQNDAGQLQKKEILESMYAQLETEHKQLMLKREERDAQSQLKDEESENYFKLLNFFQSRETDKKALLATIVEEEKLQKAAFEALQLRKDLEHKEISVQIQLIEKELSNLTAAEIKRRELKILTEVNTLAEYRSTLACILTDLLSAKRKREAELKTILNQMEMQRKQDIEDFWLLQYQKLMKLKPEFSIEQESEIDPIVQLILEKTEAISFLPLFVTNHVTVQDLIKFSVEDLQRIGILDEVVCQNILEEAWTHFSSEEDKILKQKEFEKAAPSAPPEEEEFELQNPTAPPLSPESVKGLWLQADCVICFDARSASVFLPCGHVCCCQKCSILVELCPMCRANIESKSVLNYADN